MSSLSPIEQAKRLAAYTAVDQHIKPNHRVSKSSFDFNLQTDGLPALLFLRTPRRWPLFVIYDWLANHRLARRLLESARVGCAS